MVRTTKTLKDKAAARNDCHSDHAVYDEKGGATGPQNPQPPRIATTTASGLSPDQPVALILTGERLDGRFLVFVWGIAMWITYRPFKNIITLLLERGRTRIGYSRFTYQDASRVRKAIGTLLEHGTDKEYRFLRSATVVLDPTIDDLPSNILSDDEKKELKNYYPPLGDSVID